MQSFFSHLKQWILFSRRGSYFVFLMVLLPLLILAGFGVYSLVAHGYWLIFIGVLLGGTVLGLTPITLMRSPQLEPTHKQLSEELKQAVSVPEYWTVFDQETQQILLPRIPALLEENNQWQNLYRHVLLIMEETAQQYQRTKHHAEWAFTAPELLTAVELACQRYQQLLTTQVPGIDRIKLSSVLWANDQYERLRPLNKAYQVFRKARMLTPEGLLSEVRSQLFDRAFSGLSTELQSKLQQLILLDALQLAIDLYGGHIAYLHQELTQSKGLTNDLSRQPIEPEPIRVGLIGQENAGKSSLVNLLLERLSAETDYLPATNQAGAYHVSLTPEHEVVLIDLPGFKASDTKKNINERLAVLNDCDVIIWVLKVNQPARQLDLAFKQVLDSWLETLVQRHQKPPLVFGYLTHTDRLINRGQWQAIQEARNYNQQLLGIAEVLAPELTAETNTPEQLARSTTTSLSKVLIEHYDAALQIQLQRRRIEASAFSVKKEFQRFSKGSKHVLNALKRSQQPPS